MIKHIDSNPQRLF